MGIQPSALFPAPSANALPATLYGHFTQAIHRNRPIKPGVESAHGSSACNCNMIKCIQTFMSDFNLCRYIEMAQEAADLRSQMQVGPCPLPVHSVPVYIGLLVLIH
jgi:hypothetical protein